MRVRLRQVVLVAADLGAAERSIEAELGLDLCYRDPGVGEFGLRNALFPIGDKLLEVVSPLGPGTAAGRFLDKRDGDGGYMVMVETDDLADARRRAADAGVSIVYEAVTEGVVGLHLHPRELGGAILSIDATDTWGEWPWAGPDWRAHVRLDRVDDVVGITIAAADPAAMAGRWGFVLGRPAAGPSVVLDEGAIDFVPAGERGDGIVAATLAAASGAAPIDTVIAGCRFVSVGGASTPT